MPAGITISNNRSADRVREQFRAYVRYNRRDVAYLWQDQSRKLATDLYVETAAIAPTKAEISADVRAQGWKIPRKFKDGRIGRGSSAQWMGAAYGRMKMRVKKRGRRSKADHLSEAEFKGKKPSLAVMQQFVIETRSKARLFLASGWLGAISDLGGSMRAGSGVVQRDRGGAIIRRSHGLIEVTFWNRTPGILLMQGKTDFVGKAVRRRVADMGVYIRRKQLEAMQKLKAAA